jgi:hypothetical protein
MKPIALIQSVHRHAEAFLAIRGSRLRSKTNSGGRFSGWEKIVTVFLQFLFSTELR